MADFPANSMPPVAAQDRLRRRGEPAVLLMQHKAGQQPGRPLAADTRPDQNPLGLPPGFRPQREDGRAARPDRQRGQQIVEPGCGVDHRHRPFRPAQTAKPFGPSRDGHIAFVVGPGFPPVRRAVARSFGPEGRVRHQVIERGICAADRLDVRNNRQPPVEAVCLRIFQRKAPQGRIGFGAHDRASRNAREQAQRRRAGAEPHLVNPVSGFRRYGGGQKYRIDRAAIARCRLPEPHPAAEQRALGGVSRHRRRPAPA